MTLKELLIHELDNIPDPLIAEVLDFLHFLKAKQAQDNQPPVVKIYTEAPIAARKVKVISPI